MIIFTETEEPEVHLGNDHNEYGGALAWAWTGGGVGWREWGHSQGLFFLFFSVDTFKT